MRRLLLAATVAAAVAAPLAPAHAGCTQEPCQVECVRYVLAHLDPRDPSLVCPR
jgi:hypothetical protein